MESNSIISPKFIAMKRLVFLSMIILFLTVQCREAGIEDPSAELLLGTWKNTNEVNAIAMDGENNFIVQFGKSMADTLRYELSHEHILSIYDSEVAYECEFHFLGDDQLELTIINLPESGKSSSIYHRLR